MQEINNKHLKNNNFFFCQVSGVGEWKCMVGVFFAEQTTTQRKMNNLFSLFLLKLMKK